MNSEEQKNKDIEAENVETEQESIENSNREQGEVENLEAEDQVNEALDGEQEDSKKEKKSSKNHKLKAQNKELKSQIESLNKVVTNLKTNLSKTQIELAKVTQDFKLQVLEIQKKANAQLKIVKEAEFKKLANEKLHIQKYGSKRILESIVNPLNSLEVAIQFGVNSANIEVKNYVTGFNMIFAQLIAAIEQCGANRIDPKIGDAFDHNLHEAIAIQKNPKMHEKIIEIKKKGFKLHDIVIQPAIVVIGK